MRYAIALAVVLASLAAACSGSGESATTSTTAASATVITATTRAAAPTPIMEGWHRVTTGDGELGPGGGGALKAVIEGGPGLMAFAEACQLEGGDSVGCYLGVWGSVDGTRWQQLAELGSAEFWAVASLGSLVVVGGSSCSMEEQERGDECGPALWTSTDGVEWSMASNNDQVFVPCEEYDISSCVARVEEIVELPSGGLWAYGFSALGSTTWTSRDGLVWELGRASFTTLPGIGVVRASNYGAALGDPHRFVNAAAAYRFSGLVPTDYESAGRRRPGQHISREGSVELREAIIELGRGLASHEPDFGAYKKQKLAEGKKPSVAAVAVGRRAHRLCYAMIRDQTGYDPARWTLAVAAGRSVMAQTPKTGRCHHDVTCPPPPSTLV